MNVIIFMILGAVVLALVALAAFIWSLRSGQYDDPAGAAARVLVDNDRPIDPAPAAQGSAGGTVLTPVPDNGP